MTVEAFDFRKPGRLPDFVSSLLRGWQDRVARLAGENWQAQFGKPLEVQVKDQRLLNGSDIVKRYENNALANSLYVVREDNDAMLCLSREMAIDLVEGLLDNIVTPEPAEESADEPEAVEPRDLTAMENALLKLLFNDFASAVTSAQPEHMGVEAKSGAVQSWKQTVWDIDADNEMVVVEFEFIVPFEGKTFELLIPASLVEELALKVAAASDGDKDESEVNHLVMEMPVEVVVQLGSRQLEMGELAKLKPGDVLVLDQRINQPLTGYVEGVPKYAGWPGKTGNRRVFQVSKS